MELTSTIAVHVLLVTFVTKETQFLRPAKWDTTVATARLQWLVLAFDTMSIEHKPLLMTASLVLLAFCVILLA